MNDQVEAVTESKSFMKMTPVIDIDFLDRKIVLEQLERCYASDNGVEQDYVEWDTSWAFSESAKALSGMLIVRGVPKGKRVLLKIAREEM